jgi:hypothetical protein
MTDGKKVEYIEYKAVFFKGEFVELYNESKDYTAIYGPKDENPDFSIRIVRSWPVDQRPPARLAIGAQFVNVDGTTFDDKHGQGTSWIGIYQAFTGGPVNKCMGCGAEYNPPSGHIVGGHCALPGPGVPPRKVDPGSNDVFIIPICSSCNGKWDKTFECKENTPILRLTNFMKLAEDVV